MIMIMTGQSCTCTHTHRDWKARTLYVTISIKSCNRNGVKFFADHLNLWWKNIILKLKNNLIRKTHARFSSDAKKRILKKLVSYLPLSCITPPPFFFLNNTLCLATTWCNIYPFLIGFQHQMAPLLSISEEKSFIVSKKFWFVRPRDSVIFLPFLYVFFYVTFQHFSLWFPVLFW